MSWTATIVLLLAGIGLTIFHLLQANRVRTSLEVPLVPPTAVLFVGILLIVIAGSHLLTLMGIEHNRSQLRF